MNGVNEQQVRRLDEMDEQQARQFLTDLYSRHIPEEEYNVRHEDYVMEMPQSGERFRGPENMRAFQEAYPTPPSSLQVRRVLVKEGLWVVEGVIDYGDGRVFDFVVISELRDGKMWRERWYFAEPFEAPEWRSQSSGWTRRFRAQPNFREFVRGEVRRISLLETV
jgi:SnoaL-like protein